MAKYFSGITLNGNKYTISIIDDNLNVIFMDNLEFEGLVDLLKRKSVAVVSIDAPLALYLKYSKSTDNRNTDTVIIKKRSLDSIVNSKNLFTYSDKFTVNKDTLESLVKLLDYLNKLGFSIRKSREVEKSIIETYPDTSFLVLGCNNISTSDDIYKLKIDFLRNKGLRLKDYMKRNKKDACIEINTLCQAYTAFLYYTGESTCLGSPEEGLLVIPSKNILSNVQAVKVVQKKIIPTIPNVRVADNKNIIQNKTVYPPTPQNKIKGGTVIAEYCGAQYLYTNTDGIIRINELRPIKSYGPFTDIYEIKYIKLVQVVIGTTDGLKRVKANFIPTLENSNSFKAADEEDKKRLDNFWANTADKRGYLIKFNKVEVIKA